MIEEWKQAVIIRLVKGVAWSTLAITDPFYFLPTAGKLWESQITGMPPL